MDDLSATRSDGASVFDIDAARAYIAQVRWQFATTMPQWPHEYTVLRWRPELEAASPVAA